MNKIFKVIWSKSKQCYIVVSEIAKNKTGKKKIVVAGIFAALAMVNGVQDSQAINGSGARTGWNSNGVGFHPTQGLVVGPNMNDNTTIANGNVATVAIGAHSNASGSSSVAIGGAVVNGAGAIGLGWSTATGDNSVALGGTGSTNANGNNAFAASGGNASGESAIAIGSSAIAGGRGGVAVGWSAESAVNAVGIGFNAKAKANNTVAIGVQANNDNSIGDNSSSVSIGVKTRAREVGSMAMGVSADASGKYSIALGSGDVSGDYTATVNYPKATGEKAIAIGYNSNSSNERATAIGAGATASGTDSFAGVSGAAGGNSSIAIGKGASITAPTAGTTFGGQDSIAMGTGASANQHSSVTIGAGSTSDGVRNITIGPKASASGVDSIAIGNGGVGGDKNNTGVGGNGNTYTINVNDISTNVYYGTKSVDDGSIAFGNRANAAKGGLAIGTVSIADGGIAVGQSVLSKNGVAIGSAVSATVANAVAMGSKAEASSVGAVAIGGYSTTDKTKAQGNNALAIGASAVTNGSETIAIGKSANASNANAVAVGKNAKASIANSVAIGSDSTTDTNATNQSSATINGITYNFAGATSDTGMQVSVGATGKERQIKNVAPGEVSATSTDAINGSQLFAVASQIKPINYFSVKSSAVGNKNNDGATGNDAVAIGPGAQSSGDNGVSLGNGSQANAESVVSIGYQSNYGAQNNSKSIGIGWAAGFQSKGTENIGIGTDAGRKLTGSNNVSIGKSAGLGDVYSSGSVLLGQSATIVNSTDKAAINDVVAIGNGAQGGAASSVAIGKGAKALGFSTIAIGENSNAKVKVGSAPSVAIGRNTTANGDYAVALGGGDNSGQFQGAKAAGVGTTAIGSATVTKDDTNFQTAVGFGAKTDATNASAFGYNASATANNATALGYAASATAENATALGTGAIAKVKDGVAIGSGSKATVDKGVKGYDPNDGRTNKYGGLTNNILTSTNAAVSVGEGASVTRQITGVAAGTNNTDAVNVAQLKSVNLAFSGNSGNNDVNLANGTLAIKGDTTYITTTANTNGITIAGKKQDISVNTNGVASANKGMADAQNVAQSINDAISKNAYTWTVSANGDAGESVTKGNTVDFTGDSNITVDRTGKKITTKLNKDITVDSVKANNKVTVGTTTKQLVLDGTTGAITAGTGTNTIKLDGTSATITAGSGSNAISLNGTNAQAAFGSGTNAVSINGTTGSVTGKAFTAGSTTINTTGLTSGTGSSAVSFGTNGISAGNQAIKNVSTGGSTDSNAANIGDVKRYVSGATLNLTDGANHKGSVQLGDQSLKVTSGTGINATVSGQTVNIGLTTDAQNAISNGIGLLANSGGTGIKYLKDGNATFDIKGDGSVVKTTASNSGVTIAVDTDKLAANTNLAYTANGASTAKNVALSKGLNFVNGSNTIAIVNDDGKVSFDLNAATKNQINTNTTGVTANKASITTNTSDIATNKNKIATNTTDIAANKSKIATNTTNIAANTAAIAKNISLGADSGVRSSQSLSTGDVAFNVKGATGDFISTKMNGNTVEVSTKRAQIDSDANSGAASVTGADGLATAKNVADAINNAVTKSAYEWKLSANGEATTATVGKGDTVDFTGDTNITVDRNNKNISVKLNKNLTNLSSVSIGNNKGETIKLDGSNGGITADHADFKDNTGAGTSIDSSGIRINNGIADLTQIGMGSISLDNGSGGNTVVTSSSVSLTDGSNLSEYNAKGIAFGDTTGTNTAQFGLEGISAANQQIKDVAAGTDDTDAVNVKQLKDTVGDQKLSISDGTKDSTVALKNQKLTVTGTGAAKATVNNQTITIDVAEGTLTPNTTDGTVTGTTGVAKATEVAAAINNTNTVLGDKIATNTANIAHTIALADDNGTSTTAKSLKDGNVSFNIKGDNKFISTAASGNDVTLTVNEQAIKDAAKSASSFKVKANATAAEDVKGGDTIAFNNGDNIEISQTGKTFTIGTAKNITVDTVTAGNTVINTSGLTNGTTAITGIGVTTDKVIVGGISIDKTAGINAGGKVISNVASGNVNNNTTDNSNAANIGDVKQAVANLSQNLNITDGTNNGTVDLKNQKLNVAGANGVTATVNNQTITVGLDANTVNATTKGIGLTADTGSTGNKYLKDGDVSFAVTGDGNLVSTTATTAGVKVAVDAAKVKDLAVAAVTVSKDTQADNPITVTPTAGTNSKDYAIGIDTTKLAAKTDLTYRANSAADANAKKVSLSKGLDFVDGGSTVATVDNDGKVSFDLNTATKTQINTNTTNITANTGKIATNTTNIAANTTALARHISLGADTGTVSSQSLSTADVSFNVKGATGDFVSTNMNGNTVEISTTRATINSNATTGEASVTGNDGLATAQNVADAINKAADAAKAGAAWNITTNSSTTDKTAVKGGDTVDLVNGDNIEITQDGTDKKKITVATKKDITVDSVTANNKVTVGSGANKITLDGTDGSVTGKAFTGTTFTGTSFTGTSFTAGNTVINTNGLTNGTTAITGTGVTTDNVTVGDISIDKTTGINAGNKVISNVASGGTTLTNAANIGDVQTAVANLSQNLNITDGTHDGTVDLKNQKLNVAGANGVTATVKDQTITVGLDANTVNATTKGIGLTADTGSTGNKYLKDGDVSFAVTGDGSLVSTSATAAGVKVAVNSASITAGADGTITGPTTDGVATAKNVADAINAAKKASKTEITANTGEAANATTGNVTLTSTTAADGHTIYDVKLNDKVTLGSGANAVTIDGTTGAITGKTATIGGVTVNGTANTIGGLSNTTWNGTAVSGRAATEDQLKAATSATTLKFTGDVATNTGSVNLKDDTFGIKGDNKYISTDVNGKNVNLTVSEAEVKKSAVAAVTVSTDTTDANNPLTVTPTTSADGTTKDYKVTIDGTKIANKTNLSYKANGGTAKQVSLADGLDFTNGTLTTASIDNKGVVKYDVNTASITAGADGTITGPATDGVATAKNVADAINAAKKASKTEITANTGEAANATTGNVTLTSTTAADGHTIYDVKLNDKVTLGTGANAVTVDGTAAKVTAGVTTVDGATGTITTGGTNSIKVDGATGTVTGLTNKDWTPGVTKAVTGRAATEDQLQKVADAASSQTWNITADKAGTTGAQTGTKKNATVGKDETVELVAGDNLTINQDEREFTYSLNKDLAGLTSVSIGTGTTETIKLDGVTGKITAKNAVIGGVTVDGDNNHVTGLSNTTWNGTATTGRAATEDQLKAVAETAKTTTDAVNLKFTGDTNTSPGVVNLKDDTFGIVGDGKYVSTDANGKNLTVKVSEAEVKKSAVAAVTVSTDTTDANNPLTVTPTTSADGTTKDYKVTIDGTKIANKTNLSYKANDGTAKQVSLADGLNFKNGTLTTASIDDAGVVKYDVNTASITAGADGTITGPTTDGVATAQNVADAINAAKKASKTEITANTGEAANATTGNVILTSTTAADGHTIYDVKLNDKVTLGSGANAVTIDGTAGKATIGSSIVDGVNNTFTTGGVSPVTLNGATGTITGKTANIGGVTVNGTANTIGGLSNTTWNGTATTGRAATEDQLKVVADAAGSQTWEITADKDAATSGAQTGTKKNAKVGKDDKVQLIAGENLTVNQNERDFTYSLNKDLVKMNSATFEATGGKTTVIKGDSIVQTDGANVNTSNATSNTITDGTNTSTITAGKAQIGTVGIDGVVSKISTGGTNAVVVNGADGTIKTGNVTVTGGTTNDITGLSNTTVTAADFATKGRAATEEQLKAATGATTLKFTGDVATNTGSVNLKDDTFGIKGDGKYISTDVNGKNVNLTISEAEVKKSAVAAVTVSTDTTDANNPLTVTPTTSADGTTKDYKVTIDGTKIANKTNLSYKANDGTAKQVSLADGLNFKNGTLTTASIDDNGVVKYDVNTASITAGADGTITGPTTDGVATAQNVADAINAAKKASKTEITANAGETANSTKGNVTLTSTTAADGHTIYDVKLNDKVTLGSGANAVTIDGTAGKATIGSSIVDGVNRTFTTGGANAVKLDGAAGTIKTGTVTVTGGTTNDITGLSNTTVTSADFATKGRAATEEQLKAVGEQTWQITADKDATTSGAQTGTKKNAKVGKDDKVQLIAGENLTVNQNERDFTYSLNKDLVKMNSATFEATGGRTTVIKGDSIVQTDGTKVNTSTAGGSTVADGTKSTETTADGQVIKDGAKSNKSTVDSNVIDDGNGNVNTSNATSNTITDGTNTSTVTAGKAQIGTVGIDGVASKITTGGANAVVINGADGTVKTGTVTVIGGTTNDITGLSNTTVTAADFATKGRAATEEQLKAVGEQTWQITADKDATTSGAQTGTKKDAKVGKNDKVQLIAGENMTVNQNERDFTFTLNKDLVKMNSATFEATGGKTTVIKGDSIVQTDGTKVNTSTAAGNTVVDGAKSTATTADGTTVTTANGNTNYAADGVRINTTGKTPVSLTDAGLDNGNNVIKNVASGHVNNDATDNTNAANIADVKKATTTVTANAGEAANATTGNVTLTSTTAADGHTIYDVKLNDKVTLGSGANAVTIDGTAGKATFGSSVVDGVNNTFTTGGANAVKLDGAAGTIKTGTVTVTSGTTNDITGLSNTTVTAADFATKGRAATEEQLKAVGEQTWQITADKDATTSGAQTGTKKDAKVGKNDKVQLIAGENMTVNQNERDFTFTLNKDLVKMNSATFEATGGKTTVIKGDSIVQTDGTKVNTSTAGGNTVADGTKSTETTADGQVIKDGTKTNTSTVDENTLVDGAKSNKATVDSNVVDDGNGNVNTSNATSNTITDGTNRSTITAGKATIGSSVIDGVNNTFTTGGANAVKLDGAAGTIKTGTVTVTGGTTNDITGLSNTTVTAADFATKGRAATEEQLKAVGEQTWQITADKDVTTSGAQTGTKKDAKVGKDDKVQLIAGENMTVNQNERDFTFTLNKDLVKMNSATFEATGGKITVIKGDSIVQTDGTKTNTATASGNTVANGTKSTETTADGQVIKDGAKSNKSTVSSNVIDDGTGNVNTSNATSNTITDGTNTSTITAGKATIGSSIIDGVNNTFTTGGASPVTLNGATGTITGKTANIGGVTVDGTNNHVMGLANKDWTPGVTQAVSGRAATEDQLQKVSDAVGAGWKVNTGKVTGSTGESNGATSTKVASGEEVQFQAGNNLIVDQNGKTVAYSLNKALKDLESATFNGTGTNKTVITGDSITQTAGTQTNTSTAGGNTVADGTKSTETTAAGQVIKNGAKSNKSTVDNNVIDDGTGNVNTSNATSNTITDGTNTTATTSSSVTVKDNAGNSTVITKDNITTGVGGNKITLDGTAGKATIGASVVDGVNNTFTTGGTNAVTMNGAAGTIKTGTVTVTGGTTNDITGLSNTTVTAADFATKGRAATEEQLKAVGEQTWQITADKDATTSGAQTGTKKDAKVGKNDKVQLIAGENMTVNQNERDFTFTLNKDLVKMNSATFEATGGKTTVIKGDSIVQTDGTKVNTSTAGGNTVADGTKSTETTAAGQVIKDGAKTNTSTVDENTIVDGTKSNKSTVDGNTITDGTNTTATTSSSVTVKDNAGNSTVITKDNITTGVGGNKITLDGTAGKATIGASVVDGVNNTFTTGGTNAVTMNGAAGTIKTGTVTVTGGTTNDITGLSNTTVTAADFATKGRAATEEQLKAVGEQTWQITADKDATTSGAQTGTKKDAKVGKNDKVQLIAGENMTVNQNERDFTFTLNKDLVKMNSATFEATGGKTTVIKGDSIVQTDGTKVNTSTAGGNTVADGTKSTETTAAGQVIKDGAKTNTSTVDENTIVDGTKSNKSTVDGNTITDGTNTTATTSSSVTVKDNAGNSTVITKDNITTGVGGNKITLDGTAGKATVGASVVDGVNNTFTTGGANAVKLDGVAGTIKTGTVTVTGGTTNDITGLANTTVNSADFATKGRAATEEQLKAVGEQTWQITADKDATTSGAQTGTKKDAKVGKDDKVQLIAGENMTVNQNERDFTFTLNKDLVKMNSATFLGTGSNTTVITGNSITQTAGTQTNTSTVAGNTIANGTKSTETTADGQVIKDGAKSNKSTVDSNVIDDGNGHVNTSNATSNTITDGTNTSTITAGKANIGNIAVDGVNNKITVGTGANPVTLDGANGHLDGLTNTTWVPGVTKATTGRAATEDQLQQVSDAVGAGWKVNTGTVAGSSGVSNGAASTKVSSGEEVKLQAGDNLVIDQNGKTVSYSLNKDLTKMNSATFEATGGKTTVIKGDSIVQTDGGKTNTSNAAGNTVVDGNKSTATTAAGITITDGAKTNTSTADKNVINDGAGNTNVSNATSNTLKNAAGDETKADAKGVTVKDAAGNNATFTKDGITITKTGKDTVSLTSNGLDNGKNKIVNVAAGVVNTDAVNVGQLKEYAAKSTTELTANNGETAGSTTGNIVLTKTTAADGHTIYDNKLNDKITLGTDPTKAVTVDGTTGTVTGLTNKTWTPGSIVSGRAATEDQLKEAVADSGWKAAVDKEGSGQSTVVGTSPEKIKAEEIVTFKAGNNMMVTQTGKSISYAVNPELTDMKSATFKDAAGNTTVTNGNGITITPGSANPTNPHAGPVSLTKDGLNNGNNQIKGVAPGTDPTDAVNVSQLNASNANTSQAINQIAGEVQHVGAHAAAMAALKPIQYDPLEPTQVMAGVGNYRGETAAALGLAHYTNENTMFNVGVSVGGNHNMVNAGVTHKFGYSPEKKNIPDRYKAGPISSVYVMQDEVSSLKKENAEQKYVIADQAARLTTLEAENEQQRRELAETKKGLDDLRAAVDKLLASKG